MEELLGHALAFVFQVLGELLLEFLGEAFLDAVLRGLSSLASAALTEITIMAPIAFFLLGLLLGGASLLVFPVHFVRAARLHGISLLVTPVMAGVSMGFLGARLREQDRRTIRLESFSGGFALAFGVALIRFFFAR